MASEYPPSGPRSTRDSMQMLTQCISSLAESWLIRITANGQRFSIFRDQPLARSLLGADVMELILSLLETTVSLALAVELVGVGLLIFRMLR